MAYIYIAAIYELDFHWAFFLVYILLSAPSFLAHGYYFLFFLEDSKKGRNRLATAHLLYLISWTFLCIWGIVGGIIFYGIPIAPYDSFAVEYGSWPVLITVSVVIMIGTIGLEWYWKKVANKYSEQFIRFE